MNEKLSGGLFDTAFLFLQPPSKFKAQKNGRKKQR